MSLRTWAARAIFASFPHGERWEAGRMARTYCDWLDSLPVAS